MIIEECFKVLFAEICNARDIVNIIMGWVKDHVHLFFNTREHLVLLIQWQK